MPADDFTNELFTNISALQKSVRRGIVEDALYYANTLMTSSAWGKKIVVTKILTYLVEDIGFANLFLAKPIIRIFSLDWLDQSDDGFFTRISNASDIVRDIDEQILLKLIVLLCVSPKNREVDNCICANRMGFTDKDSSFFQTFDRPIMFLNALTFSKEIKTKTEDVMNFLGVTHDTTTAFKPAEIREYYKRYNRTVEQKIGGFLATMNDPVVLTIMERYARIAFFYKELLGGKDGILLYYTFFYLASRHADTLRTVSEEEVEKNQARIDTLYDTIDLTKYDFLKPRPFPDYAYDKHTAEWKRRRRWERHFFTEWALLANEKSCLDDSYKSILYSEENLRKMK